MTTEDDPMPVPRSIPSVAQFLADIQRFQSHYGMTDTQFGTLAVRSHPFVRRMRDGKHIPRLDTVEKVYRFMADYEREQDQRKKMAEDLLKDLEVYHEEQRKRFPRPSEFSVSGH